MSVCQLAIYFSCNCPKCTGEEEIINTTHNNTTTKIISNTSSFSSSSSTSAYPISTLEFFSTSSSSTSTSSHHQQHEEDETEVDETSSSSSSSSSSLSVCNFVDEEKLTLLNEVTFTCLEQEEAIDRNNMWNSQKFYFDTLLLPQYNLLQKQHQQRRSFLQIAQALKRSQRRCCRELSQKALVEKPRHLIFDVKLDHSNTEKQQKLLVRQYKKFRFSQKCTRRHLFKLNGPYMPNWCYEENCNSQRSLREMCVVATGNVDSWTLEPEFTVYDRRLTTDHIRLPHTTARANRVRRDWILKNRIFNGKTPFSQETEFFDHDQEKGSEWLAIPSVDHKDDTRGERNFSARVKFNGKDDSLRCNRNFGFQRNESRNNGWNEGRKWNIGNSRKAIFGKPWLNTRQKKIFKGKDRLAEFFGCDTGY